MLSAIIVEGMERGRRNSRPSSKAQLGVAGTRGKHGNERVCRCEGEEKDVDEDVVARIWAGGRDVWVPIDTGARSI